MNHSEMAPLSRRIARELGFYGMYLSLIIVGLISVLIIWRQALQVVFYQWIAFAWTNRSYYVFSVVAGAFALVAAILLADPWLRDGMRRGIAVQRFWRALLGLLAFGAVGYLIMVSGNIGW
jgi:hypothetical protein